MYPDGIVRDRFQKILHVDLYCLGLLLGAPSCGAVERVGAVGLEALIYHIIKVQRRETDDPPDSSVAEGTGTRMSSGALPSPARESVVL